MTSAHMMVDTWAWLALNDESDADHELAEIANGELLDLGCVFMTTNFVLDEAYTLLRRRVSAQQSIQFGRDIQQAAESGALEIITVDPEIETEAWKLFEKYHEVQGLSYTDCTTFAAMHRLGITEAFTEDAHFSMMGFIRHP